MDYLETACHNHNDEVFKISAGAAAARAAVSSVTVVLTSCCGSAAVQPSLLSSTSIFIFCITRIIPSNIVFIVITFLTLVLVLPLVTGR
jgi:hypothetical protein